MNTIFMKSEDAAAIPTASEIIKNGGLVAFPTETVYGLGADALNSDAAAKIYAAKGRPSDNPLIVHIADKKDVYMLAEHVSDTAKILMEAFWPGPLTLIFKKKSIVPAGTTGGLDTVAIRMPSHPAALELIKTSGVYIAAPSANTSGRPSPTTAEHVAEDMTGRIDMIIDGGAVGIGIESTIVDTTSDIPTILRPGFITKKMLEAQVGAVDIDKALFISDPSVRPKAPGMKYTHYAPGGELSIVESHANPDVVTPEVIATINQLACDKEDAGFTTAILATGETKASYTCKNVIILSNNTDGATVAQRLYSALRECDAIGAKYIFSESFSRDELGGAIMNRLIKAAGHRIIQV